MTRMSIQDQRDNENRIELEKVMKAYGAHFHYNEKDGTWCLSGTDENGNYWETDNYEATDLEAAWYDATNYLVEYNS